MHIEDITETRHGELRQYTHELIVSKDQGQGPGWFIFGRDEKSQVIRRIAAPTNTRRYHPHYNGKVVHGWPGRKQAEAALAEVSAHIQKEFGVTPKLAVHLRT